jgi:hypothetical protein
MCDSRLPVIGLDMKYNEEVSLMIAVRQVNNFNLHCGGVVEGKRSIQLLQIFNHEIFTFCIAQSVPHFIRIEQWKSLQAISNLPGHQIP